MVPSSCFSVDTALDTVLPVNACCFICAFLYFVSKHQTTLINLMMVSAANILTPVQYIFFSICNFLSDINS